VALARDLRAHPIIVVRAAVLGFLLLQTSRVPFEWMWQRLNPVFFGALPHMGLEHQAALTSGFFRTITAIPLACSIGWVVARVNRTRTPVAVLAFLMLSWYLAAPEFWRLLTNSVDQGRFRPYLALNVFGFLAFTLSVVTGALLAAPRVDGTYIRPRGRAETRQPDPS
jgi:hypothetical protein